MKKKVFNFLSQCKMKTNFEKFHVFLMEESVFIFSFMWQMYWRSWLRKNYDFLEVYPCSAAIIKVMFKAKDICITFM